MPSTPLLTSTLDALRTEYPRIHFAEAKLFAWSPDTQTVHYAPSLEYATELLLHELSHGLLGHQAYNRDIELLTMETAAWAKAEEIARAHEFSISEEVIQDNLDTYRDWLHARSTCPACSATGYQVDATSYECPACLQKWRVNEARSCALRRYAVTTKK